MNTGVDLSLEVSLLKTILTQTLLAEVLLGQDRVMVSKGQRASFKGSRASTFGLLREVQEREAHWTCKLYMPQYRGTPGPKRDSEWVGDWGGGYGGPLG